MLNKMLLQGRLCGDPELRTTQGGVPVASFTVAWNETYKGNETTLFMRSTAWRATADFINKYFSKGQEIVIEGPLATRKYIAKDGTERTVIEMTVDKAHFCGKASDNQGRKEQPAAVTDADGFTDIEDDELPF